MKNYSRNCLLVTAFLSVLIFSSYKAIGQQTVTNNSVSSAIEKSTLFIDSLMKKQAIPGLSIAVGSKGKVVWTAAWGLADVEQKVPVTTKTQFRIGSISKTLTAFALGKLAEQKKINLDSPIGNYIPLFQNKKYPVTIRQIAGHQGGIRHYQGNEFISNTSYKSVEESLNIFQNDSLLFEPGTQYLYSSYGYSLLSRAIEVASGKPFLTYMKEDIFTPIGITSTIAEDAGENETGKAKFYLRGGVTESPKINLSSKWAGGGFLSTPTDLITIVNNATRLVSFSTLLQFTTPQKLINGKDTDYGIGWRRNIVNNGTRVLIHHGGTSVGAKAFLLVLLNEQLSIAICTNGDNNIGLQEVYDISKFFLN